ncbi:MAG TPA: glutamyl-tRNA reductase [Myxococcota bacterium]|jgi:glutamyl-tRNA reductase|nr:glutamyl-tRNA reductase [Myxococcota bacterium]
MAAPSILLVGLSHRTAPVAVRERFAFDEEGARAVLADLSARGLGESVLLSTCNRTEVYAIGTDGLAAEAARERIVAALCDAKGAAAAEIGPHLYALDGVGAVRHLFRVAASLDSLVLGEPQILGQAKTAYRIAGEAGTVGPVLGRFFERAFKVAKEIRTNTGVGTGQVSVGSIAVDLARKVFGDLGQCTVLLLGAGKMAEAVAKTLSSAGAQRVVVANRTVEKAMRVAERYGWTGTALADLPALLVDADVVIASVASPGFVADRAGLRTVMARRRYRPMFLVDIAVPRVLDPQAADLEGVYLYNIDDFNQIIADHLKRRAQDVRQADAVVAREVEGVDRYLRMLEIQPLVSELGRRAARLRERETARALHELGELTDAQRKVVEALAGSLVNKLMADPLATLRDAAQSGGADALADAARRLFRLDGDAGDEAADGEGDR